MQTSANSPDFFKRARSNAGAPVTSTVARARHHAKKILAFAKVLGEVVPLQDWKHDHYTETTHVLESHDGRFYKLHGLKEPGAGYVAVILRESSHLREDGKVIHSARTIEQALEMALHMGRLAQAAEH
jgi:hypothetical protein